MQKIITVVQTKYKFIFLTHKRSPEFDILSKVSRADPLSL